MHQTGMGVVDDGQSDIGKVRKIMQSPVDDNLVVFTGTKGINWITEDCGANLRALNSGKRIHEFHFHPKQRTWALAAGWTSCEDFADDEPCEIYKELYATKDMGATWQYMKNYVFDFSWGVTAYSSAHANRGKNHEARIFITHEPDMKGHQRTRERWKQSVHLYYSDDFFKTQKQALDAGNSIVMTNHYMFVAKAVSSETVKIHVSRAEMGFLDFRQARMPKNYHITDHFTVMDTSEKSIFLYISDNKVANPVGNLFVSDGLGYRFTHSLENIIKGNGAVDFETVESLDGTYLANRYDSQHGTGNNRNAGQLREITEDDILAEEASQAEHQRMGSGMSKKQGETHQDTMRGHSQEEIEAFDHKIKSYITHNKGASWELIKAPEKDMKGKHTDCFLEDGCSLHLNMYSNNDQVYAPPYSQESSIGIVMAVGNLGDKLDFERGARKSTFLSRDGGLSWAEVSKIPLIYEFGDHGGLLVAAPNLQSTTQIRYSWNEGKTWQMLKVSDEPIFVDNIIIEPKSTAQQFVIYGSYDNTTENGSFDTKRELGKDVMITLDFAGLHEPRCKGVDKPGKDDSDFELWSPHDDGRHGSNDKCFLGQQVTYIRRKQDSECFNGEDFERQTMRVPCLCTEADYECDMNYILNKAGKCEEIKDTSQRKQTEQEEDCALEGFYSISQGYRKIPGNKCYGGLKLDPKRKACNSFTWFTSLLSSKTFLTLGLLGGILYYGWPIIEAIILILPIPDPKDQIEKVKGMAGAATGFVSSQMQTQPRGPQGISRAEYSSNLESAPDAYIEGDDSDDELGGRDDEDPKSRDFDYDSDEKNDEEKLVDFSAEEPTSELIELSSGKPKAAKNIPKLSGPS
mmetsp:Transcript_29704/g.45285  ORF Transcript_29704/g.45285 Transcript_29704/m.45285 type:complete len:857 (-) Transcript_29704:59-2629(-)